MTKATGLAPAATDRGGVAPTIEEIKAWPATVSLPTGCTAFGIGKSYGYELAARGEFPARVLRVGGRMRVVTASILAELAAA